MKAQMISAVVTGDIIRSRDLTSAQQSALPNWITGAHAIARNIFDGLKGTDIEIFRGESWQYYSKDPSEALHAALMIRGLLKGRHNADTRISIGYGRVESLKPKKISLSRGSAFTASGHGLDAMPKRRSFALCFDEELKYIQPFGDALAHLLDAIVPHWTQRQALACGLAATGGTYEELATRFDPPISKQAFGKHLAAAEWDLVERALQSFAEGLQSNL